MQEEKNLFELEEYNAMRGAELELEKRKQLENRKDELEEDDAKQQAEFEAGKRRQEGN